MADIPETKPIINEGLDHLHNSKGAGDALSTNMQGVHEDVVATVKALGTAIRHLRKVTGGFEDAKAQTKTLHEELDEGAGLLAQAGAAKSDREFIRTLVPTLKGWCYRIWAVR